MLSKFSKKVWIVAIAVTGLILSPTNQQTAVAGDINSNEQGVISAAEGTFYYAGEAYVAADVYKKQLRQELLEDDVNLTAKEANDAISEMYANIKQGIDEGYLVKVKSSSSAIGNENTQGNLAQGTKNVQDEDTDSQIQETTQTQIEGTEEKKTGQNKKGKNGNDESTQDEKKTQGKKGNSGSADSEEVNKEPEDGTGAAAADGAGADAYEDIVTFNFLDSSVPEAERSTVQITTAGAATGAHAARPDKSGENTVYTSRESFADILIMVLAVVTAGSAYLLYRKYRKKGK